MSDHEHFRELSALAAIGQLSSSEDKELDGHLRDCAECREAHADYVRVVRRQLPQADAIRSRLRPPLSLALSSVNLRDEFLARARAEGMHFSPEAEQPAEHRRSPLFGKRALRPALGLAVTAALVIAVGIEGARKYQVVPRLRTSPAESASVPEESRKLRGEIAALQEGIERNAAELERVKREKSVSDDTLRKVQKSLEEARLEAGTLRTGLQEQEARNAALSGESHEKEALVGDLSAKNEKLRLDNVENLSERVILEARVRELNDSLEQQSASLERERQLMTVGKDVRQLIGARSLHIIDVHDVDGGGKAAKAFGRVFYAENQSLIFYAFDLPSGKLTPAKYTFQAWGQKEYAEHSIRNLGTFEVDDHEQRRWVLKVTDPKLLHDMDSVFVTAETLGDVKGPHGRKLMYAYVMGQANHP